MWSSPLRLDQHSPRHRLCHWSPVPRDERRPTPELFEDARRVLGYLYRNPDLGLRYDPSTGPLSGMSDSDWAVKHSTTGYMFSFGSACISWASKKQPSVALSSCEAELMVGSESAKEALYLSNFLGELGFGSDSPV